MPQPLTGVKASGPDKTMDAPVTRCEHLDGAVVQADKSGDQAQYGANLTIREIVDGQIQVPSSARRLIRELKIDPRKPRH
jgi:hypothetical protein